MPYPGADERSTNRDAICHDAEQPHRKLARRQTAKDAGSTLLGHSNALLKTADEIVIEERTGIQYKERRVSKIHRIICDKAGLPKNLTPTSFRHGGATEIGDMGENDMRAITGHTELKTTAIYNKASVEKAQRIGLARRAYIEGQKIAKNE